SHSTLPSLRKLRHAINPILCRNGTATNRIRVFHRRPNVYASTFPTEFVTCLLADGAKVELFCKYQAGRTHRVHGHRGDVAYEAEVYRRILRPLGVSTPKFYGTHVDKGTGDTWLILESLSASDRVAKSPDQRAMRMAAHWIGRFHAASEMHLGNCS